MDKAEHLANNASDVQNKLAYHENTAADRLESTDDRSERVGDVQTRANNFPD